MSTLYANLYAYPSHDLVHLAFGWHMTVMPHLIAMKSVGQDAKVLVRANNACDHALGRILSFKTLPVNGTYYHARTHHFFSVS